MPKLCLIGCGGIATQGHGPSLQKYVSLHPELILAGCCDLDAARAESYRAQFGFAKAYTDYEAMLDELRPDAVLLTCTAAKTCELSIAVMKKGYNILLEKPPGDTLEEITAMIAEADLHPELHIQTAFNRRHTPLLARLKQELQGKRIYNITYQLYRHSRTGDFANTAVHAIDAVKFIAGADYKEAHITFQELPEVRENVANFHMSADFENGVMAQLSIIPMGGVTLERITVNTPDETYTAELPFWSNMDSPGRLRGWHKDTPILDIPGDSLIDSTEMFEESGFYAELCDFLATLHIPSCDLRTGIQSADLANYLRTRRSHYVKG